MLPKHKFSMIGFYNSTTNDKRIFNRQNKHINMAITILQYIFLKKLKN